MISAKLTDDRPFTIIILVQFYNTSPVLCAVPETLRISVGVLFQLLKDVKINPDIPGAPWRLFPLLSVPAPFPLTTAGGHGLQYVVNVGAAHEVAVGRYQAARGLLVGIARRAAAYFADELGVELLIVYQRGEVDAPRHLYANKAAASRRVGQRMWIVGCGDEAGITPPGGERAAVSLHGGDLAFRDEIFHYRLAAD